MFQILQELNAQHKASRIDIVRVYDEDYNDWEEYLMYSEKSRYTSPKDSAIVYRIIDNTRFKMNDWEIGINDVDMYKWRQHVLSINKIIGIIDIINEEIDNVMSECNESYPRLFAMPLMEIKTKVIYANKQLSKIDEKNTIPESVVLSHLRENYVSIRYDRPKDTETEGTIKSTQIFWTTEYVASKEIDWKRGDKSPIAFQDGNIMRMKKG